MKNFIISTMLLAGSLSSHAQQQNYLDTLPNFSIINPGKDRGIIINWVNTMSSVRQVTVQRSADSLKWFRSIFTVEDPVAAQNGYVDKDPDAKEGKYYYRLFIMMEHGHYLFSEVKRPILDTNFILEKVESFIPPELIEKEKPKPEPGYYNRSKYVFTQPDGIVQVVLPADEKKQYIIKFFTENETFLFDIKNPATRKFKLDKGTFLKAGWYSFELLENDDVLEKNRFYLPREF